MRVIIAVLLLIAATAQAEIPSVTDAAVRTALSSGTPAVIDLGARTCIPCRKMAPILELLSAEYRGRASVLFIDVRENNAAAERFKVRMIPTQIFFDAKGNEVKRHVGFMEKADIVKELKSVGVR